MRQDELVVCEDVSRFYGEVLGVNHVSLLIEPGVTALVGPNGAGKTTLLRLIAGLLKPDSGSIAVFGHDSVREVGTFQRNIGYMPQRSGVYDDLTVGENLRLYADLHELDDGARRSRFAELLDFTRLGPFVDRLAGQLSGGMKQKLALACTLIHTPEVLFLDEPTTGVDPVSRREFWKILYDLLREGVTIFVSTPYMDEAERCSRIGLFYRGRLMVCAAPETVRAMVEGELLETSIQLCPAEEAIWHKAFIMERERYDGADVMHLILRCGEQLDWARLLRRFGDHWRVLFAHLVMFNFVYPGEHTKIPTWVLEHLTARLQRETRRRLPLIRRPLLVVQGRLDRGVHASVPEFLKNSVASSVCEVHWMEKSGHCVILDQEWEQVAKLTLEFLQKVLD